MTNDHPLKLAQIGCGYWGTNIMRNAAASRKAELTALCDRDSEALQLAGTKYPQVELYSSPDKLFERASIDAVLIVTPSGLHYEHILAALNAGKHVFVEKPLATSVEQAVEVVKLAEVKQLTLMVGHTFLYNNIVHEIDHIIESGELGEIYYIYGQRLNLGRFRHDTDVLWTLAPHDISILNYWLKSRPNQVSAKGLTCVGENNGLAEVCFAHLDYPGGCQSHLHLSWLDPQKIRQMVLVGSRKMLIYDDMNTDRHIQIFDKKAEREYSSPTKNFAEFATRIRAGDLLVPNINLIEPLSVELDHFIDCINNETLPRTDGRHGLEVVAILEAFSRSMLMDGCPEKVEYLEV